MPFETDRTSLESGVTVLTISGTMTMGNQLQRLEWAVEELTKNQQNRIVVDLSAVTYVDSSAIGVLVGCHGATKNSGGQLRLAAPTERVMKIFHMGGVDHVFHIDPTREAAISQLTPAQGAASS